MDTTTLNTILTEEMRGYTGEGLNGVSYLVENHAEQLYTVIDYAHVRDQTVVGAVLVAQVIAETVIIDLDRNYPPLVESLIARNVPREQIILAYMGEPVPEAVRNPVPAQR